MNNVKEVMVTKDKLIKTLAFLKVKKYLGVLNDGEFVEQVIDIYRDEHYCEVVEKLSHIVFDEIVRRIEDMRENYWGFKILFNEGVSISLNDKLSEKVCDVILLSKGRAEVIRVVTRENDIINSYESPEMKLLGAGVIDKFLTQTECEDINLTIIQPNLLITTIFQMGVEDLLHECEYSLL